MWKIALIPFLFHSQFQYDHPGYDPQKYCESAPVLRQLNCAPPSEKKKFRDAERRRLGQLDQ